MVECRTHNQVNPCSNPPFATVSKIGHFSSSPLTPQLTQSSVLYTYDSELTQSSVQPQPPKVAVDSRGNVSEYRFFANVAWLECFPENSSWCQNGQV